MTGLRIIGEVDEETKSQNMVGAEHFHLILKAIRSDLQIFSRKITCWHFYF